MTNLSQAEVRAAPSSSARWARAARISIVGILGVALWRDYQRDPSDYFYSGEHLITLIVAIPIATCLVWAMNLVFEPQGRDKRSPD